MENEATKTRCAEESSYQSSCAQLLQITPPYKFLPSLFIWKHLQMNHYVRNMEWSLIKTRVWCVCWQGMDSENSKHIPLGLVSCLFSALCGLSTAWRWDDFWWRALRRSSKWPSSGLLLQNSFPRKPAQKCRSCNLPQVWKMLHASTKQKLLPKRAQFYRHYLYLNVFLFFYISFTSTLHLFGQKSSFKKRQ